jgi:hypothetical protein
LTQVIAKLFYFYEKNDMQNLSQLETSIERLSDDEYAELREWFWQQENERWDNQLEKDISADKLANLANEALENYKNGKFKSL